MLVTSWNLHHVPSSRGERLCFLRCLHLTASSLRLLRNAWWFNVSDNQIFSVRQKSQWRPSVVRTWNKFKKVITTKTLTARTETIRGAVVAKGDTKKSIRPRTIVIKIMSSTRA